jgi:valyl-tRNA synthetase
MPFITEEIWYAIYDGKPPQPSIAMAEYPLSRKADEISPGSGPLKPDSGNLVAGQIRSAPLDVYPEVDRNALLEMAILQDLIVNVRNVRAELKVEPKAKVPVEVFAPEAAIRGMIEQNRGAVERLANVEKIAFVKDSLAKQAGARSTARFDVHVIYERKIDVAAESEKLKKELEKIEKEFVNNQRQLGNEQFLAKAPANVVEGLRRRAEELVVLQEKTKSRLTELGRN